MRSFRLRIWGSGVRISPGAPMISMAYGRTAVLISKLKRCLERQTFLSVPFGPGSRRVAPGAAPSPRTIYRHDLPARRPSWRPVVGVVLPPLWHRRYRGTSRRAKAGCSPPIRAGDIDRGQYGGDHVARMSASAGKHIVAVKEARHDAVGKRRQFRQGTLPGAKYARTARYLDARSNAARDAACHGRDRARARAPWPRALSSMFRV
jgi:hypothetical protein